MADLRSPVMADISYDGGRRHERGGDFARRQTVARSLKFERQKAALLSAVEFEVVPRLLSAHQAPVEQRPAGPLPGGAVASNTLAFFALGRNQKACAPFVQDLLEQGMAIEQIYLDVVAPAASQLRQMWIDDERGYAEVTLALWHLQQLLREFSPVFRQHARMPTGQRALLTLPPGQTHELPHLMFLLVLSGEFLRRDGWNTWIEPDFKRRDAMALIRTEWFDVVQFQISDRKRLDTLAAQIKAIRAESINRTVCIALAGQTAHQHPELLRHLGADVLAAAPHAAGAACTNFDR
jgi:AcrR family transcriptional regulator